jgi:hypothetical protein
MANTITTVPQPTQSVTVNSQSPNQVTIVDRGSIVGIAAASDKHKSININVNDWSQNGSEWEATFNHGLSKHPAVTVTDSFGQTQYPDIEYIDDSSVKLTVRGQFSGKVYFN